MARVNADAHGDAHEDRDNRPPAADHNPKRDDHPGSNTVKNPDDWTSGDEPMTGAQASYLKTLSEEAKAPERFEDGLSKAEASKRIDALKGELGR